MGDDGKGLGGRVGGRTRESGTTELLVTDENDPRRGPGEFTDG